MKRKLLSLLMLVFVALGAFAACDDDTTPPTATGEVDYVAETKLDMNSASLKQEVTIKYHIDGDTTHFHVPKTVDPTGVAKVRYLGINTPESTGTIEEWGKEASDFTKSKLMNAEKIMLESDADGKWEYDANDRFLAWVWYKPKGEAEYRNLNVELLQVGLALSSKTSDLRYGDVCFDASYQAQVQMLALYSEERAPGYFYGDALPITLKELRTNQDFYDGKKVKLEVTVTLSPSEGSVFVEDYDEETECWYGITVFYGYNFPATEIFTAGNRLQLVCTASNSTFGFQLSSPSYNAMNPDDPKRTRVLETGVEPAFVETDLDTFLNRQVDVTKEVEDPETGEPIVETKTYAYKELALSTSISFKNLTVKRTSTTTNEDSSSKGAISLYCEDEDGNEITVRTTVLRDADGNIVTEDLFKNKTIDVKGIVDYYVPDYLSEEEAATYQAYQISVNSLFYINIHA